MNLQIALGSTEILMMLMIPLHEHVICFHLFVLQFLSCVFFWLQLLFFFFFTTLIKFIPRYFILFEAIVSEILFLVSISDTSLLMYKEATDFWIFILYLVTLLNSFVSSRFWWNLLGTLYTVSCHLQIMTVLHFFQLGCLLFLLLL